MNDYGDTSLYAGPVEACPICGGRDIHPLHEITRFRHPFRVDRCETCRFIFMNPRFSDAVIEGFYSEDYFKGNADYTYHDERGIKKYALYVWNRRIEVLHRYAPSGNFLDVGASFGGLMEAAQRYYTSFGIELSAYAAAHAASIPGTTVHRGTLDDHPFAESSFAAITMIELIEHLRDPAGAVRECFRLLRPGGVLVIQTANMAGLQAKYHGRDYNYYLPGHLSYFTKRNLKELLLAEGFSRVKVFHPVEFGLLPKLRKSRGSFHSLRDYRAWIRISWYHFLSKLHAGNICATSSMVVYAFK